MEPTTLENISAIATIITPFLLGLILFLQSRFEANRKREDDARARAQRLEDETRETRMELAEKILMPFFDSLDAAREAKTPNIDFREWRKMAFRLSLYGDDEVFKAFNRFMQLAYSMEQEQDSNDPLSVLQPLGGLLLAIRRSAGNKDTTLGELEILEWMISDLRTITSEG